MIEKNNFIVTAIGASSGGLDAFEKFFDQIPYNSGMAFILVQHLDPLHNSLLAELVSSHTRMKVHQVVHGMKVRPNHVYTIPPGTLIKVVDQKFSITELNQDHGQMPFDTLLESLAVELGRNVVCIVFSGNGADGSQGIFTVAKNEGYIIVQDPEEARYDGMPKSAIATGLVDNVLTISEIPNALLAYDRWTKGEMLFPEIKSDTPEPANNLVRKIIEHIRKKTSFDFSHYKHETLRRRITYRMSILEKNQDDLGTYLQFLQKNSEETEILAKSFLINYTEFFRNPNYFKTLAENILPKMITGAQNHKVRVWCIGCSSGEEVYSLAIIFMEQILLLKKPIDFQIIGTDIDPDAIETARAGLYPSSIENNVSQKRLKKYFSKEKKGYRVSQNIRSKTLFSVHDIINDPPFSKIDLIFCRNLLIYLTKPSQEKILSLFEFSLNHGGILVLGESETVADKKKFKPIFSKENIFEINSILSPIKFEKIKLFDYNEFINKQKTFMSLKLPDLCRRMVLESFAPATVVVNEENQCIFAMGPTETFLRVGYDYPNSDILAMALDDVRGPLREAISHRETIIGRIKIKGSEIRRKGNQLSFNITVEPIKGFDKNLLLICFLENKITVNEHADLEEKADHISLQNHEQISKLKNELTATKLELSTAEHNIRILEEKNAYIASEAAAENEEFQISKEELMTSQEEMQTLNDQLRQLNTQLQELLDKQKRTSEDLQNILYSSEVATIFLDKNFCIRFFTPEAKVIFNILQSDIGRPLNDLNPLSADRTLHNDMQWVLSQSSSTEKEIKGSENKWFKRRINPYISDDGKANGVVLVYQDISEQKRITEKLNIARRSAEIANSAKGVFLATASHDLRQPLQTLLLLQEKLASISVNQQAKNVIKNMGMTLVSMKYLMNSLMDINRTEFSSLNQEDVNIISFRIGDIIANLAEEFSFHAEAKNLKIRSVHSKKYILSDPQLLEQILRNLLSNSIKFTQNGKILIGCRHKKILSTLRSGIRVLVSRWTNFRAFLKNTERTKISLMIRSLVLDLDWASYGAWRKS